MAKRIYVRRFAPNLYGRKKNQLLRCYARYWVSYIVTRVQSNADFYKLLLTG